MSDFEPGMPRYFTPDLFRFLRELKANNNREWFAEQRARFEADVEGPMLQFIADVGPRLARISPAIVARPRRTGGSLYRIYRDTRFSADKSPYKTNIAAHFAHERKRQAPAVPGFYLHLEPGNCMGGGGIYHPDPPSLTRIRLAIVERSKEWAAVRRAVPEIEGERLKRAPAGFSASHPFVEDLKLKDFYMLTSYSQDEVCGADFMNRFVDTCQRAAPLVGFIGRALGLRW